MKYTQRLSLLLVATVCSIPLLIAHAAGGRIEGKITDPKGAAIPAATVTVTNQVTKQDFTATTDAQGKYKIEGLPAGSYTLAAWHEMLGEKTIDVVIGSYSTQDINFKFNASEKG